MHPLSTGGGRGGGCRTRERGDPPSALHTEPGQPLCGSEKLSATWAERRHGEGRLFYRRTKRHVLFITTEMIQCELASSYTGF